MNDDQDFIVTPTPIEVILSGIIILASFVMTSVFFWLFRIGADLSFSLKIAVFVFMFFVFIVGLQAIFNCFYIRWQRKDDWVG